MAPLESVVDCFPARPGKDTRGHEDAADGILRSVSTRERLIESLVRFGFAPGAGSVVVSEERVRALIEELRPIAALDIKCTMVGGIEGEFATEFAGLDGFADAWADWLATFERLELKAEGELIENGDHFVALGRQVGVSATAGVEVESDAAAVWTLRDEKLARVEFHLDRESALRAAGVQ